MNQGLFESLTGHFADGQEIDGVDTRARRNRSIMDHLSRMFNTRSGSIGHLPDYGIPDISEIYRRMPHGIDELRRAIVTTIEKYEPRIKNVKVIQRENEEDRFTLVFIISGELIDGGRVRFQTTFNSVGNSSIVPFRKTE